MASIKLIVYWGLIGICGAAILIGFLGLITARAKSCCTISLFSFLTLIGFVAFLLIGGLLTAVTIAADNQLD